MSYDIYFQKNGEDCVLPDGMTAPCGGTYCLSGEGAQKAWLNITFNYCKNYSKYHFGIVNHEDDPKEKYLNGKTAKECIKLLCEVIPKLGSDKDPDYWKATDGNARQALMNLLLIASNVPEDAVCVVDY